MNDSSFLFTNVLNMSLTASYVILGVILIRLLLKKAPKVFSYALWVIVLVRLICPISFNTPFSILGLLNLEAHTQTHILKYIPDDIGYEKTPEIRTGISSLNTMVNESLPPAPEIASVNPIQIWLWGFSWIWLAGVLLLLTYALLSYVKMKKNLSTATLVSGNIYETDRIGTAFVCGLLHPKIYLPLAVEGSQKEYILIHEQIHIHRLDYLIKPLAFLALALHWFNPLVWLAFSLMSKDMEMSCDEGVLRRLSLESKESYSYALLSLSVEKSKWNALSPLAFGESHVKTRIKNVLHYKKPHFWGIVLGVFLVALSVVVLLTNPIKTAPKLDNFQSTLASELMAEKTPYVGNNSKVSALVHLLPLPEDMAYNGTELKTKEEPYKVIIFVKSENMDKDAFLRAADQDIFQENSALLYALIGNVTTIEWRLDDENPSSSVTFDRLVLEKVYGQDLRNFSQNEEMLMTLMKKLPWIQSFHASEIAKNGLYQINKKKEILKNYEPTTPEDLKFLDNVIFDFMIKSAAWPGINIDELDTYMLLRREGADYYIYKLNGKTCIQMNKDGFYSILDSKLYEKLQNLLAE